MTDSFIQGLFAERIGGKSFGKSTAIYKFEKIKRAKRAALAAHPDAELIDLGVGEPDEMAFPLSVRALCEEKFRDFHHGLKLIARDGDPRRFAITREVIDAPDKVLSRWVVESFKQGKAQASNGTGRTSLPLAP